jgi:hypothetical protein
MPGMVPPGYRSTTGNTEQQILSFFQGKGLTRNQAAGIVGNLKQESALNPSEHGGFLAQWLGDRLAGLQTFSAAKHVAPAGNTQVQLEYIWHELTTSETGALTALRKAKSPEEAATVFSQKYERPGQPELAKRIQYAKEAASSPSSGEPFVEALETGEGAVEGVIEAAEAVPKFLGSFWGKLGTFAVTGVLLLAGAFLVVYGIMVAVRPRESAFSIPFPKVAPVPV